jgi:hypothetical protein
MNRKEVIKRMLPYMEQARQDLVDGRSQEKKDWQGKLSTKSDNERIIEIDDIIYQARLVIMD